ncbi:MAG: nicotinamide riboside transporter PnuC [Sphingobium phenoxybenzoativorans]|uniref:Nicotinamide riboside transporter PnuC n=1 Tax=Sphingobium phenoxybenzoativorans TaxID=1592790 RepID=A0A975Q1H6_9SPHN|nr:nicotinamide riboside transporter PnuC [Sphingobium phenoxybenzoativorans]QUT05965.1 nicotinamide riboside transporter PnuC [Sphingobium phenoxybenzoativorans]
MTALEILAVALGLANILLLVRRSVWNYPFGIAMVCLYAWIFFHARLYSDTLLQFFFLLLNAYGWFHWSRARDGGAVPVRMLRPRSRIIAIAGVTVASALWGSAMARWTDAAAPHWDGAIAMLSVLSQYLLAKRFVENWIGWIIVDCLAILLFWTRGLQLTAGLYLVFLILSVVGLREWLRARAAQSRA